MNTSKVSVDLKKYPLEIVRYAAYSLSGKFFVLIRKAAGGKVELFFSPKRAKMNMKSAGSAFKKALEEEACRSGIWESNKKLREFLIIKAITGEDRTQEPEKTGGLTPEQEKELEKLIAEVEDEIKKESAGGAGDPLKIKQTWEEKYGDKSGK